MDFKQDAQRFYLGEDAARPLAEITWHVRQDGALVADHTFTDPSLRGQGVARKLVDRLAAHARENGLKLAATCPYAVKVLAEPEFSDIYLP